MNLQEKLALIEEVLDVETGSLTPETLLAEVGEWDSIAALSLVVMLDEKFEKTVSGAQIKALESVNKSIKGTQSGLKDVNKLLKLDPSNTELVAYKQEKTV